jgi:hypothetical protein
MRDERRGQEMVGGAVFPPPSPVPPPPPVPPPDPTSPILDALNRLLDQEKYAAEPTVEAAIEKIGELLREYNNWGREWGREKALRLAIDYWEKATGKSANVADVLDTANQFLPWIRPGHGRT